MFAEKTPTCNGRRSFVIELLINDRLMIILSMTTAERSLFVAAFMFADNSVTQSKHTEQSFYEFNYREIDTLMKPVGSTGQPMIRDESIFCQGARD